jgi:N-methylhydantoinase A/oxoprolinase/acetone carboxylase beta subunit
VLSALGMLVADVTRDYSISVLRASDRVSVQELDRLFAPVVRRATADLRAEGFSGRRIVIERSIDVRYAGQSYELAVPFSPGYRAAFDRLHGKTYGYSDPARATEVVTLRVRAAGITDKPDLPFQRPRRVIRPRAAAMRQSRFDGRMRRTAFYYWPDLLPGSRGRGPAVITGPEATVVVPPRAAFAVDGFGNVIVTTGGFHRRKPRG